MKIFMTVLTVIFLVLSIGMGYMLMEVDKKDAGKISKIVEQTKKDAGDLSELGISVDEFIAKGLKEKGLPSVSTLTTAKTIAMVVCIVTLICLVLFFMNSPALKFGIGLLLIIGIVSVVMHPAIDKGTHGGVSNNIGAMIHSGLAFAGGLFALYAQKLKNASVTNNQSLDA